MISFIMPAYKATFLKQAVRSILNQTSPDWELVIVDDCSPEPLREIVEQFDDPRIEFVRNETNLGRENLVRQWNHSISFAKGDYIVLAADDDIYRTTFCEEVLRLAGKYPQVDLIHSSVEQIDENDRHLWDDSILPEFTDKYEYLHWWLTGRSFTCIGNFAFKRQPLLEMGGFMDFLVARHFAIQARLVFTASQNQFGIDNTVNHLWSFGADIPVLFLYRLGNMSKGYFNVGAGIFAHFTFASNTGVYTNNESGVTPSEVPADYVSLHDNHAGFIAHVGYEFPVGVQINLNYLVSITDMFGYYKNNKGKLVGDCAFYPERLALGVAYRWK